MKWIFILFIFSLPFFTKAEIYIDSSYTSINHFSESDWQNITKDHKYEQPKTFAQNKTSAFSSPEWLKYATYSIAVVLLVFLIYKLIVSLTAPSNKKVTTASEYSEIPEDELSFENTELEKNLAEAIHNSDYRRAIRYSYLIVIRELSMAKLIVAAKDKTNYEYIRELNSHPVSGLFSEITRMFEKTWYGEMLPAPEEYSSFENKFTRLRSQVNTVIPE